MAHIENVVICDKEDETSYTACLLQNNDGWHGWIKEHPKVRCESKTKATLLEDLERQLYKTLEADWDAWDKQLEQDAKDGKLDSLFDDSLKNLRAI